MNVFHLFSEFRSLTMIWSYNQLRNLSGVENHLGALTYLGERDAAFQYWDNPKYRFTRRHDSLRGQLIHLAFRKLRLFDRSLSRYLRDHDIDLLHCHFGHIGADYFATGKALDIPVVVSFYGYDYGRILHHKPRYRYAYQRMFGAVDAVTCEGPYAAGRLRELGCPPEKIHVISLGVDVARIPVFHRYKPEGRLRLVQVASLSRRKGHRDALRAFALARQDYPGLELDFYGPPDEESVLEEIRSSITAGGLAGQVRLLPPVPYEQLHDLLKEYHVFIQPSLHTPAGDCEGGAPVALLDAQATGMPVIGTTHCDIPHEVRHGRTGLLTPEGDVDALAESIRAFAAMGQEQYDAFAVRAREQVASRFGLTACAAALRGVYEQQILR